MEGHPNDLRDLHCREARLPVLVFRVMGSAGTHIFCHALAEAVAVPGGIQCLSVLPRVEEPGPRRFPKAR